MDRLHKLLNALDIVIFFKKKISVPGTNLLKQGKYYLDAVFRACSSKLVFLKISQYS